MFDAVTQLFSAVCGQSPEHTWMPGGVLLPVCQRCSGLYVGAAVAIGLHLCLRPRQSRSFAGVHAAFLLLMVPFGYHWVPQGPALRTLTGILFGFGLVTFLRWPLAQFPESDGPGPRRSANRFRVAPPALLYGVALLATCVTLPFLAVHGGQGTALLLAGLVCVGAAALGALAAADIWLAAQTLRERVVHRRGTTNP